MHETVRAWRPTAPLAAAVYSHHHIDHVLGTALFDAEAAAKGWERPVVYAHEEVPAHFRRYEKTGRLEHGDQPPPVRDRRPPVLVAERVPRPGRHLRQTAHLHPR